MSGSWSDPRLIGARRKASDTDPATAADFSAGDRCAHPDATSLYTMTDDGWLAVDVPWRDLAGAPFAYRTQFDRATRAVLQPFGGDRSDAAKVLPVLSIGRCGSTLLARLLAAADVPVVSEPDVFTALGDRRRAAPADPALLDRLTSRAGEALGDIGRALGPSAVKLRSQASVAADAIAPAAGGRVVFVTRDWTGWRRSMARAFPDQPPETVIDYLLHGLWGVDRAVRAGADVVRVDYATLSDDPAGTVARILDRPVDAARVAAAAAEDSQKDTALDRARVAPPDARLLDRYDAVWRDRRQDLPGHALGLDRDLVPAT